MAIICYADFQFGLGDTLRTMYSYYVYCLKNDIPFYIHFNELNPLNLCFNRRLISQEHTKDLVQFQDISGYNSEVTENFLKNFDSSKNYLINSNAFGFVPWDELNNTIYKKGFLEFLGLSDQLKSRMSELCKYSELMTSIHVRCGDMYMPTVNIGSDSRITVEDSKKQILELISDLKNDVLLFTDSLFLKNNLKNVQGLSQLKTCVHHTALRNSGHGTIDSVAEFFLLGKSKKVIVLSHSGFSFWSTFLNDTELFKYNSTLKIIEPYTYDKIHWT